MKALVKITEIHSSNQKAILKNIVLYLFFLNSMKEINK